VIDLYGSVLIIVITDDKEVSIWNPAILKVDVGC